ncbi:Clp protease N-terminal domain-containing protein [Streptomyces solicathayae]|uniref:Clp protease N-terminal domain-containing protein n=1 Tax=Streptomyces solicathayae TaxID=3081768 RepID=A0ABZ0M1R8_9ACTN|nr:Clp protease N-terminal domain-containing protein [Streptomyces sp. HUAS YS2]WOX25621.1 Clp protease N-terminal domain-containing protein [Streptomyces sp. HUAS YS2]
MHHPVPRIPAQPAPHRVETEARLTLELATVVSGARRRALRDGDRQVDTAHLLHSLVESDPAVRAAFEGGAQLARVLGYLVQRSIGYGLRWRASAEAASRPVAGPGGWSPAAAAAMEGALERAALRGEDRATGLDVLAVVASDPDCRAFEVLLRAGVEPDALTARIAELSQQV